jgi:hypothetical protein
MRCWIWYVPDIDLQLFNADVVNILTGLLVEHGNVQTILKAIIDSIAERVLAHKDA